MNFAKYADGSFGVEKGHRCYVVLFLWLDPAEVRRMCKVKKLPAVQERINSA